MWCRESLSYVFTQKKIDKDGNMQAQIANKPNATTLKFADDF